MRMHKVCAMINLAKDQEALLPLTDHRPIAALPFGCRYRIIDFMLSSISHANVDSVALFIKGSGRSIYDHIRSGKEWNLDSSIKGGVFTFSQQLWKLQDYLYYQEKYDYYENHRMFMDKSGAEYVVVIGGEIIQNIDIEAIEQHHIEQSSEITVVYKNVDKEALKYNRVREKCHFNDQDQLLGYLPIETTDEKISLETNVYFMKKSLLNELFDRAMQDLIYEDVNMVIRSYISDYRVSGFEYTGYMAIVDSLEAYYHANMSMLTLANFNALFYSSQPIITRSKSGVPTYYAVNSKVKNAQFATGCMIKGVVEDSLIARKVTVGDQAIVKKSLILQGSQIGNHAHLEYVIADKGVIVDDYVTLIGTPEKYIVLKKNQHVRGNAQ